MLYCTKNPMHIEYISSIFFLLVHFHIQHTKDKPKIIVFVTRLDNLSIPSKLCVFFKRLLHFLIIIANYLSLMNGTKNRLKRL